MCIAPNTLPNGTQTACHRCWQCRERAINDWTGRNIAEMKTAKACHAVTLTYGRNDANDADHERSVVLTYSDVQKFLYLLRRHGYPVRYFVAGEFGTKKGRAHWHIILYWQDRVPDNIPLRQNWMFARYAENGEQAKDDKGEPALFWPHGWSYWQKVTPQTARYVCKYLQKGMGDDAAQGKLQMSKYPPLGSEYFQGLAERHVKEGLAPQTLEYSFQGVRKRDKKGQMVPWTYMLTGRTAELYLDQYIAAWKRVNPDQERPKSPLVDLYEQHGKIVRDEEQFLNDRYMARWMPKGETRVPIPAPERIAAIADKARAERGESRLTGAYVRWERQQEEWVRGAEYEQERQRRQEQFEWERELRAQHFTDEKFGKPEYVQRHEQRVADQQRVLDARSRGDRLAEYRAVMEQQWNSAEPLANKRRRRVRYVAKGSRPNAK